MTLRTSRREPRRRSPGKFRLRRLVTHTDPDTGERYQVDEPWEWKATQRPPFVVRAERRAATKRQRQARKAGRR